MSEGDEDTELGGGALPVDWLAGAEEGGGVATEDTELGGCGRIGDKIDDKIDGMIGWIESVVVVVTTEVALSVGADELVSTEAEVTDEGGAETEVRPELVWLDALDGAVESVPLTLLEALLESVALDEDTAELALEKAEPVPK